MPTPCWLKHVCSIRALVPVSFFFFLSFSLSLSLSLFFRLIPWSAEALWVHFPARASKTLSRRCSVTSPHREGAWGLHKQSKPHARGFIGFLRKPRNISLFLSFTCLSSTLDHQVPIHERTSTNGYVHQWYWSIIFFFSFLIHLSGFGIRVIATSQNEFGSVPASAFFGGSVWEGEMSALL